MVTITPQGRGFGMVLIMVAGALWGTVGVASQEISAGVAQANSTLPLSLSFLRLLVAAPILLVAGQWVLGRKMWSAARHDVGLMGLMGVLIATSQSLYLAAISYIGVAVSTLLVICAAPILVTLITALQSRQRPSNFVLFSGGLAVMGTILLIGGSPVGQADSISILGIGLAFGSALTYAGVILCGRALAGRCHPLQVNAIACSSGAFVLAMVVLTVGFTQNYSAAGWGLILYLGAIPTAVGYGLFLVGMRTTPAPIASVMILLEPLTATLLAWVLFDERLNLIGIGGMVMLLTAIYLLSQHKQ